MTQIVKEIPTIQKGITSIQTQYPVVKDQPVEIVKVKEYEKEYQVSYVSTVSEESFAVVVNVNKKTGKTVELSTYTEEDITEVEEVEEVQTEVE